MAPYRTVYALSTSDTAYIAGLIDGEGTVTLVRRHQNERKHLAVSISSTEKQMLEFVRSATGVGKITNKRVYAAHHRPSFTYAVYNRQALQLLIQVEPYLRSYKKHRSVLAIRQYISVTPRNGKYNPELLDARQSFEDEFLGIKP
ncbi:MAG: LAGLIDADG family homing endonuclease [Pseudomonadota bacterium]